MKYDRYRDTIYYYIVKYKIFYCFHIVLINLTFLLNKKKSFYINLNFFSFS